MTRDEMQRQNDCREIQQVAIVTDDVERDVKMWVSIAGVGPWTIFTYDETVGDYLKVKGQKNEKFGFKVAYTRLKNIEIELLQPLYNMPVYESFLDEHGPGLHHIKEKVSDEKIPGLLEDYQKKGVLVIQEGKLLKDIHYYLDTQNELKTYLEIGSCPENKLPDEIVSYYPER